MVIQLLELKGTNIAQIISDKIVINDTQDALDLIANAGYLGSRKIIIHEKNIAPDFFDLKTKIAGEILQKFSTYGFQLAIVGDFKKYNSKSLSDFIYESNKYGRINFASSVDEANERLVR